MVINRRKVGIIDTSSDRRQSISNQLKSSNFEVISASDPRKIPFFINHHSIEVLILDFDLAQPNNSADTPCWLQETLASFQQIPIVLVTNQPDFDKALECIDIGASNVLHSSNCPDLLIDKITQSVEAKTQNFPKETNSLLIGKSKAIQTIQSIIEQVAPTEANILITGENGTGKGLVAKEISLKSKHPSDCTTIDVGVLPENLFESELFGYKKGAFTDAKADQKGKLHVNGGTCIFLDEIGNISLKSQAKLLSVLQTRSLTPLGCSEPVDVHFRLITATNQDLPACVHKKQFRQDLYYRLNTVEIKVPPLRERKEDIAPLCAHFLQFFNQKYNKSIKTIDKSVLKAYENYSWPGNIRELEHTIERAVIFCECETIEQNWLPEYEEKAFSSMQSTFNLAQIEAKTIIKAIEAHKGNLSKTSLALGITRSSLYNKLDKYKITIR